jgi:hypothetical protein
LNRRSRNRAGKKTYQDNNQERYTGDGNHHNQAAIGDSGSSGEDQYDVNQVEQITGVPVLGDIIYVDDGDGNTRHTLTTDSDPKPSSSTVTVSSQHPKHSPSMVSHHQSHPNWLLLY